MIMVSRDISTETNNYLKEVVSFYKLKEEQTITTQGSVYFETLTNNLFICRFLHDCINKGLEYQKKRISRDKSDIAKGINPEDAKKIPQDFESLKKNQDLILILAYEFFLNYLEDIVRVSLKQNPRPLKIINEEIKYKVPELVDKIVHDPTSILEDLINILIFGSKEEGNLKISPEHWIQIIEKVQEEKIKESNKAFWRVLGIRRNASSHVSARREWEKIEKSIDHTNIPVWLYGILFLGYTIDSSLCKKYQIATNPIFINLSGEPIYDLQKVSLWHSE